MSGPGRIVGRSTQVQSLLALLERVAVTDTPLLIVGEPGTYKEAFADAVHQKSRRRDAPFLVVDCGGPDGEGLESELFGDERGETAGKEGFEKGAFEAASGGLFSSAKLASCPSTCKPRSSERLNGARSEDWGARAPFP
jgi:transcriptional regulator with GAF, ATPase, and Fis domain